MNKIKRSTAGFTLIELLIVVIIVAVLAAVGIPLLSGNVQRARMTEADSGLGTMRTAMRAKIAESPTSINSTNSDTIAEVRALLNFNLGDLTGRFFEDNDYEIVSYTAGNATVATQYCIQVTGDDGLGESGALAAKGIDVNNVSRSMNQEGTIFSTDNCSGTPVN